MDDGNFGCAWVKKYDIINRAVRLEAVRKNVLRSGTEGFYPLLFAGMDSDHKIEIIRKKRQEMNE